MRVLHAIHDYLPRHRAGSELYVSHLAAAQSGAHDVAVLCAEYDAADAHGRLRERSHDGRRVLEVVNNWRFASFAEAWPAPSLHRALAEALDRARPDVLHVHNLLNLSLDLPAMARARAVAVVATAHDFTPACPSGGQRVHRAEAHVCFDLEPDRCARCFRESPFFAQLQGGARARARRWAGGAGDPGPSASDIEARLVSARASMDAVQVVVAPTAAVAADLERLGFARGRIRVSDYGFPPLPATARVAGDGRLRVGYVGTLAWHKGVHVLVEALRLLPAGRAELVVHGDPDVFPEYTDALRRAADGLPVRFAGPFTGADAASSAYASIDVLAVPSLWPENSPLVVHEAFQAGLPVVAARMGGLPERVPDGVAGLLVEPGSAASLAAALRRLVEEPGLLSRLAAGAPAVKTIGEDAREWEARYAEAVREVRPRATVAVPRETSSTDAPLVSVIIPTWNGMGTLPAVLAAIRRQQATFAYEVVAVDSGSTDGTAEWLEGRVDSLTRIQPGTFNHGATRNHAIAASRGRYCVLLVQDAVPEGDGWLEALVAPLVDDPTLAGTFARQVPRADAGSLTRFYLSRWVAARAEGHVAAVARAEFDALPPYERYLRCVFDNVCSCVRREVWEERPFPTTAIAEDVEWARDVLLAGHRLAYVPGSAVVHSHDRPARYELWRTYLVHRRLRELFGIRQVPSPIHLGLAMAFALATHLRFLVKERLLVPREVLRAVSLAVAFPLGQYLGALSADTGWRLLRPRGV